MLQLSCLCDIRSEPGYCCLWQTVNAFRRFADELPSHEVLDYMVAHPDKRIDPGPCRVMLQRLHMIAWSWIGQGWFQDHQGLRIHLKNSPIQLLKRRLQHGWRALACATAAERKSMQGLAQADVSFTLAAFQRWAQRSKGTWDTPSKAVSTPTRSLSIVVLWMTKMHLVWSRRLRLAQTLAMSTQCRPCSPATRQFACLFSRFAPLYSQPRMADRTHQFATLLEIAFWTAWQVTPMPSTLTFLSHAYSQMEADGFPMTPYCE